MIEDKLSPDERRRLECLAQAVATCQGVRVQGLPSEQVLDVARRYDEFVSAAGSLPAFVRPE